jgi:hypothetical protein
VNVDGDVCEVEIEPGKKGFAIRETIAMYGARLLNDIYERPEFYYVRREIPAPTPRFARPASKPTTSIRTRS